jgi:hypothetical protein
VAGGNGFVGYPLRIPVELRTLIESYQNRMKIVSFNQALRTLIETHPEIDAEARAVYARAITSEREEQPG